METDFVQKPWEKSKRVLQIEKAVSEIKKNKTQIHLTGGIRVNCLCVVWPAWNTRAKEEKANDLSHFLFFFQVMS